MRLAIYHANIAFEDILPALDALYLVERTFGAFEFVIGQFFNFKNFIIRLVVRPCVLLSQQQRQ